MKSVSLKILCIGDVISDVGIGFLKKKLKEIRSVYQADLIIVNGENSASQNGISSLSAEEIFSAGADIITTGNHVFRRRDVYSFLDESMSVVRPANFPGSCPGSGYVIRSFSGFRVLIMNLLGTLFMENLESPFAVADRILKSEQGNFDFAICDLHAEATSEKKAFARAFDSRFSVIFGTHTHVQTSDVTILPKKTGYITDLGFCGAVDSVLGMNVENAISRFVSHMPSKFEPAVGKCELNGAFFEVNSLGECISCDSFIFRED